MAEAVEMARALSQAGYTAVHCTPHLVKETCYRIKCSGYVPMIAHPERCAHFAAPQRKLESRAKKLFNLGPKMKALNSKLEEVSLLDYLKEIGCLFQGNLGS